MADGLRFLPIDERGNALDGARAHLDGTGVPAPSSNLEWVDCLGEGTQWVHLRLCRMCGPVGCCDNSSPRRHATTHRQARGHPVLSSAEPGGAWAWCAPDGVFLLPTGD
jgi:Zn-finger in ubiquitin-hydrolases and other protein